MKGMPMKRNKIKAKRDEAVSTLPSVTGPLAGSYVPDGKGGTPAPSARAKTQKPGHGKKGNDAKPKDRATM